MRVQLRVGPVGSRFGVQALDLCASVAGIPRCACRASARRPPMRLVQSLPCEAARGLVKARVRADPLSLSPVVQCRSIARGGGGIRAQRCRRHAAGFPAGCPPRPVPARYRPGVHRPCRGRSLRSSPRPDRAIGRAVADDLRMRSRGLAMSRIACGAGSIASRSCRNSTRTPPSIARNDGAPASQAPLPFQGLVAVREVPRSCLRWPAAAPHTAQSGVERGVPGGLSGFVRSVYDVHAGRKLPGSRR